MKISVWSFHNYTSFRNVAVELVDHLHRYGYDARFVEFRPLFLASYKDIGDINILVFSFTRIHALTALTFASVKTVHYTVVEGRPKNIDFAVQYFRNRTVITPSRFAKEELEKIGLNVADVIPHQISRIDVDYDYGKTWRARYPLDKKILLYYGYCYWRKGLDKLFEASRILYEKRKDFVVVVHTKLDPRTCPVDRLRNTEFFVVENEVGLEHQKVMGKLACSDFYVHPSLSEGFGLTVLESMVLEKPVIAINAPGVNELVDPSTAFMVMDVVDKYVDYNFIEGVVFRVADYSPKDLAETIDSALDSSKDVVEDKVQKAKERSKLYRSTYDRFLYYVENM